MAKGQKQRKSSTPARKQGLPVWVWAAVAGIVIITVIAVSALSQPGVNTTADADSLPREISVAQAAEMRDSGAFILDVREPDEWVAGHIPDATLIPLAQLESRLNEVPQDQEVVVVCRSGNRSATARDILLQSGFDQVASMAGGMNDWQAQGLPTITGE